MTVKVAINGYGTIGKRVADAVMQQDDMVVCGVTKRSPSFEAKMAIKNKLPLYAASEEFIKGFEEEDIPVKGTLSDLIEIADIVIDCTPKKSGYLETYKKAGKKAIFQGGEKHELTGLSFNALANYESALGADYLRVVSCNTTGLCRTLYPLDEAFGIANVTAVMIRRGADPWDSESGPINAIEPVLKVPSHHGPDVQSVMPNLSIQTTAVKVPTTIMHLHSVVVRISGKTTTEDVLNVWKKTPRLMFVSSKEGIKSTAQIMELAKDLGKKRADLFQIALWEDGVHVVDNVLYYYQAIHQEADVVPENIDAVRAMCSIETNKKKSMKKTDMAMGIL